MLLEGIRVLDLSGLLPGGYCSQVLQQHGAQVLKVEGPSGDGIRRFPNGEALFEALHAGKALLTLDLRSDAGRRDFLAQVERADVLVEGFRPGVMERLGLGYETLHALNPALVYCAITGYGSSGRLAGRAGHDLNYLALSGALSLMPRARGIPVIPGLQVADLAGGLEAAFLISAALAARSRSGRGARVEVSMMDLMRRWTALPRAAQRAGLPSLGLSGEVPCYQVYEVADGFITVAALESKFWTNLCQALGRPDFEARQFDPSATAEVAQLFKRATRAEWAKRFSGLDVCVEPVLDLDDSASY